MATEIHGGDIVYRQQQFSIDNSTITFERGVGNGTSHVGRWCSLSADMTVQLAADGEGLVGKLLKVQANGLATLEFEGARMKADAGDGITLVRGRGIVGALGAASARGYVRNPVVTANATGIAERLAARGTVIDAANNIVRFPY